MRAQKVFGALRFGGEFVGHGSDAEIIAMQIQQIQHKKVCADESVLANSLAGDAQDCGDGHVFLHFGHVAGLAGIFIGVVAVLPL